MEKEKLNRISEVSLYSKGIMATAIEYCFNIFSRHMIGTSILEMGPAEGIMTDLLASTGKKLAILEGAISFCNSIAKKHPDIKVYNQLFEEFIPDEKYDNIIMGHVLEHVKDPVQILKKANNWLTSSGQIFAAVPNSRSIHRQAAVNMGILKREDSLNELDIYHGHRRVFNPETFRKIFLESGYKIQIFGGYWLKPLSNSQIEKNWNKDMIKSFMQLGEKYPDIAAEIYVYAKKI